MAMVAQSVDGSAVTTSSPGVHGGGGGTVVLGGDVTTLVVGTRAAFLLDATSGPAVEVWVESHVIHRPTPDATRTTTSVRATSHPFMQKANLGASRAACNPLDGDRSCGHVKWLPERAPIPFAARPAGPVR